MKKLIVNFLVGRGGNKVTELASKWVRHGIGWIGAYEIGGQAVANADQLVSLESGALVAVSILWSMARVFISSKL